MTDPVSVLPVQDASPEEAANHPGALYRYGSAAREVAFRIRLACCREIKNIFWKTPSWFRSEHHDLLPKQLSLLNTLSPPSIFLSIFDLQPAERIHNEPDPPSRRNTHLYSFIHLRAI